MTLIKPSFEILTPINRKKILKSIDWDTFAEGYDL